MKYRLPYLYRLIPFMLLSLLTAGGKIYGQGSSTALSLARQVADGLLLIHALIWCLNLKKKCWGCR